MVRQNPTSNPAQNSDCLRARFACAERSLRSNDILMKRARGHSSALSMVGAFLLTGQLLGCSSQGTERGSYQAGTGSSNPGGSGTTAGTSAGNTGSGGSANASGTTAGTTGSGSGSGGTGSMPLPKGTDPTALIPARIRRLSNAEYDRTVDALLGTDEHLAEGFAPDSRQSGFTVNDAQRIDAVLAKQLFAAAETLAADARPHFADLAPCSTPDDGEACASSFIESFGAKAYRRSLDAAESAGLLEVYRVGAEGATYEDGIELVIRAVLQSAGFLYLTELGNGVANAEGAVALTPQELASSLSYLLTAGPPDQALLDAASAGELATPEGRVAQLMRLREQLKSESDTRLVRLIREWLSVDRIDTTAKDSNIYPRFEGVKPAMVAENTSFIQAVLDESSGNVRDLLGADWTVTSDSGLIDLYDAQSMGNGRVSLPKRRGILNQGAFLSVHAHAHESSPVLRGVAIARKVVCLDIPSPASLNINVVPPVPDPSLTTRERFAAHSTDPGCAQCHSAIDPFGNPFEQFDGMGDYRDMENGRPVDSTTTIAIGADFDGSYNDSNELAEALANSPSVRSCFARQLFRAAIARSDSTIDAAEDAFVEQVEALPVEQQGDVLDTLITFVSSPIFTHRRTL